MLWRLCVKLHKQLKSRGQCPRIPRTKLSGNEQNMAFLPVRPCARKHTNFFGADSATALYCSYSNNLSSIQRSADLVTVGSETFANL